MKKILLILIISLCWIDISSLKAQCYGTVNFDISATAGANANFGNSSFDITTSFCNELILIGYDGWNGPGAGPVTVNGNPATYINNATNGNSGTADVYAYQAGAAGTYSIVCSPNGYNGGYYCNFAAAFYVTGSSSPISIASLTNTINTIVCTTGGTITDNITTAIPGSMIYATCEINEGQPTSFPISWTGASFLGNTHTEDGIDASDAYTNAAAPGTYTITATNASPPNNGCGGLTVVLVNIPPPLCTGGGLVASATQIIPTCGQCNGSINITVSGGTTPYTYTWTPNASSSNIASNLCGGTYSVTVQDASCPPKDTTLVFVLPSNSLGLTDTLQLNDSCNGNCNGQAEITTRGGQSPYVYSWAPGGQTSPMVGNLCAGNYTVTVNDVNGCSNTILVAITQPAVLAATTAVTNALCNGGYGSSTATPTGGTSPYTYSWSTTPSQNAAIATGLSAGTYTVNIIDIRGCTASTTATITQPSQLDATLSGPAIVCNGNDGTLVAGASGGTSPYNYTWSNGVTATGNTGTIGAVTQTYTVTVTDANNCTATAQILVTLGPTMAVSINGPVSICKGLTTTLCANVQGGTGGNSYTWQPGNAISPCINVSPTVTTGYTLTVMDNCGTTATAAYTLRVNPLPATAFTSSLGAGCAPLCVQFYNTTTLAQGNAATYLWTFGNGDSSKIQSPIYCYSNSGDYTIGLTVISDSGCSSTLTKPNMIMAFPRPNGAFTYSPQPVTIIYPTVQFTNESTDVYNIIFWSWSFGDNSDSVSFQANPSHTYQDTGRYCVNMVATDIHGCSDTTTNCLVVDPSFTLYIPSAFTPNGDNRNPIFAPKGEYLTGFEMYIFDRWGMQLYHTTDINKGWDGTIQGGGVAQEDTYVYKIIVSDSQKKQHTYVGNVTLLK